MKIEFQTQKNPVTKSLAQINRLIDSAIYCTEAIKEPHGQCPGCNQSGIIAEYKKVNHKGKTGSLMKFCCSNSHNWRITMFPLRQNAFKGTFQYKGKTYEFVAANPKLEETTAQ